MLERKTLELPPIGTNAHILFNRETGESVLIDAPLNAHPSIESFLVRQGLTLKAVLYTHGHWDHILDGHLFAENETPSYGHEGDRMMFENPSLMASFAIPGMTMQPVPINYWIDGGDTLTFLGEEVSIFHVPGHSPGSVAFYLPVSGWLFSGDVVFAGSVGRTDFPGCSSEELIRSITMHILPLPDETVIFPGHGPETTVGREKSTNPFLQGIG